MSQARLVITAVVVEDRSKSDVAGPTGALIALRATDELKIHFSVALRNGLSQDELSEVVYHVAGYAGYPAAAAARGVGRRVFNEDQPGRDGVVA